MIRPKRLEKGDLIGIISPASPPDRKSEVDRSVETLEGMGYRVVVGKNVNKTKGIVSASETERADDFNEMFARNDVKAILATGGGYGSAQILRHIDFDKVAANPKIFVGYSDITTLHLAINKYANLITFHGPGAGRFNPEELSPFTKRFFFKALEGPDPIGEIPLADDKKWIHAIGKGLARGQLTGGNLTLICSTLGTGFSIDTEDKILFIEDVDTEPWVMDHMMCHLRNAGKLDKVKGVVVAECTNCVPFQLNPGFHSDLDLEDVLEYYLKPLNIPVLHGLPLGHARDIATLPLGVEVMIDAQKKKFTILESGVI